MDKRKLDRLIDASIEAHNAVHKAARELDAYCIKEWGFAPSDRDVDEILDQCYGLCGSSNGMDVNEFITIMDKAAK